MDLKSIVDKIERGEIKVDYGFVKIEYKEGRPVLVRVENVLKVT